MTWAIVAGLITLFGFFITVGTLGFKLSSVLTRLEVTVANMDASFRADRKAKEKEHEEMYSELEKHEGTLADHEIRLHDLERRNE